MTRINVNLLQVHNTFVSSLFTAHQQNADVLDGIYQEKMDRLDQYMGLLTELATEGMEEHLSPLLNTLLQEWAIKEAVELILRSQPSDPSCQSLQRFFWDRLERHHQALSSELFLHLQRGKEQRARAAVERTQSWQQSNREWATLAITSVQQAQGGMKQWYDFAASMQATIASKLAVPEQAIQKTHTKKWTTRITIIGLMLVGFVALFGCAFFAMMHLY